MKTIKPEALATKTCPTCRSILQAQETTCPECGAVFDIQLRLYCPNCHKLIRTRGEKQCPECQGFDLIDPTYESKLVRAGRQISEAIPSVVPGSTVANDTLPIPVLVTDKTNAETKLCPLCAETIKAEARLCRFCGARFEVSDLGYCTSCHGEMTLDANGRCSRCGSEVIDRHYKSVLITTPAPAPAHAQAPGMPVLSTPIAPLATTAAPMGVPKVPMSFWQLYFSPKGRIGRLTFFLKGFLALFGAYFGIGLILGLVVSLFTYSGDQEASLNASYAVIVVLTLPLLWCWLMLVIKRLHDLDRSGWNVLTILIPIIGQLVYLGFIIACFFIQGTGPNRYGNTNS
jgi:uncharacterized membrane protein YhaH (DUF805 family)/RNA polymerase subunit RPABC4/transcription elongation factor Spt4